MASEVDYVRTEFTMRGKLSIDSDEVTCSAKSVVGPLTISFEIFREESRDENTLLAFRFVPVVEKQTWASVPEGKLTVWHSGSSRMPWAEAVFTYSFEAAAAGNVAAITKDEGGPFFGYYFYCDSLHDFEREQLLWDEDLRFYVELRSAPESLQHICLPCVWSKQMWADMLFTDMHLVSKDREEIPCHRAVLCGVSSVFKTMLTGHFKEASHNEVLVRNATAKDIRSFLEFVYTNDLPPDLDVGALAQILRMADMYDVSGLAQICSSKMLSIVDKSNAAEAVDALMPHYQSEGDLAKSVTSLIDILQQDRELLVAALSKVRTLPSCSSSLDSEFVPNWQQDIYTGSQSGPAQLFDGEKITMPLLQPEHHEHVKVNVLQFPLPAPGLDPPSFAQSSKISDMLSITVLCFSRCTEAFSKVLRSSDLAQALSKQNVELEPDWANGAKVFVSGLRSDTLKSVMKLDSLRPWHVIVRSQDEPEVVDIIDEAWRSGCFRSKRPHVRQTCTRRLLIPPEDLAAGRATSTSHTVEATSQEEVSAFEYTSVAEQFPGHHVSLDAAGTVHYPIPSSLSPRSIVTSPIN